ncbi:hypothetical protein V2J09_011322 [Rumex salicifolius]
MGEAVSSGEQSAMALEVEMNKDEERRSGCKDGSDSLVRWERFLPKMVVRVLLVEADDSTRQLITAFLRKCNYKVAAVADGLRAWEILKERSRNIDLILTEVDLPAISGFALLSLITEDEICKNIPVIMMSSHDSIGTVHKCMMKGAADFLMKPIRINELKNLWQHVWRRQSCKSAIGFGLSLQVESVEQMKIDEATAESNTVSDQSSGSKSLSQRKEECFKKGSDAQSSCTNPSLEARSSYAEEESQGLFITKKKLKPLVCDAEILKRVHMFGSDGDLCKGNTTIQGGILGQSFLVTGNDLGSQASERTTTTRAESCREAIDLIGAFDNKGINGDRSCSDNGPKIFESSELNLSWSGFQLNGFESNTNRNSVLIQSNASAFSRYTNKQSQVMPRESTMNSVEHYATHVGASYNETNGRSSLSIRHREEAEVTLPFELNRPHPVPIAATDVNSSQHFTGEQRLDRKASISPATDQSGSESFYNGALSHTNWHGRVCTTGNNVDERSSVQEKNLQQCCTQREAALMKFRLKRKERCYEKKVRYESRKKLADQRPRVKGQFVRRIPPDPPPRNREADYAGV